MDHDASIDTALDDLSKQEVPNIGATARKYGIHRSTLSRRFHGKTVSRMTFLSQSIQRLNTQQEKVLIRNINRCTIRGLPPTPQIVRNFAEEILHGPVGKNWVSTFVERHKDVLMSKYLKCIDSKRFKSEYRPMFESFYKLLEENIHKYDIEPSNIYNWDEKGFVIGFSQKTKRIFNRVAYTSGKVRQPRHDGNREYISLLAFISASGEAGPPTLIYKSESGDIQSSWTEGLTLDDKINFASTSSGWTCDKLGLQWLTKVFDKQTRKSNQRNYRLLIVDGHTSHVNMQFIDTADRLRIIILILPPHTTQRLQPLDVCLFGPLATAYSKEINKILNNGLGYTTMTKQLFLGVFKKAWTVSFTSDTIQHAWEKSGIWPINGELIMSKLPSQQPNQSDDAIEPISIPNTSIHLRRITREVSRFPAPQKINHLCDIAEELYAQHEMDQITITGLIESLKLEKVKRKRGKALNLLGESSSGSEIYTPGKVNKAREYQANQELIRIEEDAQKEAKKVEAQLRRERLQQEKEDRAIDRQARREVKQQMEVERRAAIDARKAAQKEKKARKETGGTAARATRPVVEAEEVWEDIIEEEEVIALKPSSHGRQRKAPRKGIYS